MEKLRKTYPNLKRLRVLYNAKTMGQVIDKIETKNLYETDFRFSWFLALFGPNGAKSWCYNRDLSEIIHFIFFRNFSKCSLSKQKGVFLEAMWKRIGNIIRTYLTCSKCVESLVLISYGEHGDDVGCDVIDGNFVVVIPVGSSCWEILLQLLQNQNFNFGGTSLSTH